MTVVNLADEWTGNKSACLLTFRLLHAKLGLPAGAPVRTACIEPNSPCSSSVSLKLSEPWDRSLAFLGLLLVDVLFTLSEKRERLDGDDFP